MRRLGFVLFVIGVFLVAAAPLVMWYVAPELEKTPNDSVTEFKLAGSGQRLDRTTGALAPVTLVGTRSVYAREKVSSVDVTVYDSYVTVQDASTGTKVSETAMRVALDRHTGQAVSVPYDTVDGASADITGLVLKFPFHTERKSYDFYDGRLNKAYPATFDGVEEIGGLEVYRFVQKVSKSLAKLNLLNNPAALVDGAYQNLRTLWVEPDTGIIVKGQEEQQQWVTRPDGTEMQIADLTIAYDDAAVAKQSKQAEDDSGAVALIGVWVPLAALVLGLVVLILGVVLWARDRDRGPAAPGDTGRREPDPDDWRSGPLTDQLPKHAAG